MIKLNLIIFTLFLSLTSLNLNGETSGTLESISYRISSYLNKKEPDTPIELFDKYSVPNKYYVPISNGLQKGDIVTFNDGMKFEIVSQAGHGGATRILKAIPLMPIPGMPKDVKVVALRIPLERSVTYRNFLNHTISSYPEVAKTKLNLPEMYGNSGVYNEYAAFEFVEHNKKQNGRTFFEEPEKFGTKTEWKEAAKKLKEFARQNYDISNVQDFNATQIIYDKKNKIWRLLDYAGGVEHHKKGATNAKILFNQARLELSQFLPDRSSKLLKEIHVEVTTELFDNGMLNFRALESIIMDESSRSKIIIKHLDTITESNQRIGLLANLAENLPIGSLEREQFVRKALPLAKNSNDIKLLHSVVALNGAKGRELCQNLIDEHMEQLIKNGVDYDDFLTLRENNLLTVKGVAKAKEIVENIKMKKCLRGML